MTARRKPTSEDLKLKARAIRRFFDEFEERINFAVSLYDGGRENEAFILTCSYIEAMATYLRWPRRDSRKNFCRVLLDYGGESNLELFDPRSFVRVMSGKEAPANRLAEKIESLGPSVISEMCPIQDFIEKIADRLDKDEIGLLRKHAYLGTLASVAYKEFRCSFAHRGGGPKFITFDKSSFSGGPAPELDFITLVNALRRIVRHARDLSESTNTWFGHDQ